MKRIVLMLAFALAPLAVPAHAAEVVAKVGGTEVSAAEVKGWLATLPTGEREAVTRDPARLSQAVRAYLARRLVLKEAEASKFDQTPEVKSHLERVRETALTDLYLASVAKVPEEFPSEAELQSAYEANKTSFVAPRQYKLEQIFVKGSPDDKNVKAKLADVQKKLKARGADFVAVAKEFSDADAGKGVELGWLPEDRIVPEIRSVVAGLAKGAVSDPVRLDDGWHVLKLEDTKPAGILQIDQVKAALTERLRAQYAQRLRQAYFAKLTQQNPTVVDELELSKLAPRK